MHRTYDDWKTTEPDDWEDFEPPEDEEPEEVDVDVCLGCGRYYGMTEALQEAWRKSFNYREGAVMDQLCLRCMEGYPPPHEY